jgi:hypothetical protein
VAVSDGSYLIDFFIGEFGCKNLEIGENSREILRERKNM